MRRGFTLIETIFSAFIISLVIITIFNLYPSSMVAIKRSEMQIEANAIAQSLLEEMRSVRFSDLLAARGAGYTPPALPGPDPLPPAFRPVEHEGITFTPQVPVEVFDVPGADPDCAGSGEPCIVGIRSRVTWSFQSKNYEAVYETWVHNLPR